ncbi:MAG: hypothetical protein AB7U76_24285 [Pirellulales bacterium]
MGLRSKVKGKVGEREVAALLREYGYEGRRGVQFQGGPESPDVQGLPGIHVEVKRTEGFRLWAAMAQARMDAKPGDVPTVWHRSNKQKWVVVLDAEDFLRLYRGF